MKKQPKPFTNGGIKVRILNIKDPWVFEREKLQCAEKDDINPWIVMIEDSMCARIFNNVISWHTTREGARKHATVLRKVFKKIIG